MIGRNDENGPQGDGVGREVMFTQNFIDRHGVAIETQSFDCLASQSIDNCTDKRELAETCRNQNGCGVGVAIPFKGGQSANGGIAIDDGACQTLQSKMSAVEPTVAVGTRCWPIDMRNATRDPAKKDSVNRDCHNANTEKMPTLSSSDGKLGDNTPSVVIGIDPYNGCDTGDVSKTLNTASAQDADHTGAVAIVMATKQQSLATAVETAPTMGADDYKEPNAVAIGVAPEGQRAAHQIRTRALPQHFTGRDTIHNRG